MGDHYFSLRLIINAIDRLASQLTKGIGAENYKSFRWMYLTSPEFLEMCKGLEIMPI